MPPEVFTTHEKAVLSMAKVKSVGSEMTASQRKTFAASDVVVQLGLGTESWGKDWTDALNEAQKEITSLAADDAERKAGEQFVKALAAVRFCLCGIRIDDGLGCNGLAVFRKDDADAKKWSKNLKPMSDTLVARYLAFLPKQTYPIRSGVHPNTAFGLAFAQSSNLSWAFVYCPVRIHE